MSEHNEIKLIYIYARRSYLKNIVNDSKEIQDWIMD